VSAPCVKKNGKCLGCGVRGATSVGEEWLSNNSVILTLPPYLCARCVKLVLDAREHILRVRNAIERGSVKHRARRSRK
jgi:hypothetical protein